MSKAPAKSLSNMDFYLPGECKFESGKFHIACKNDTPFILLMFSGIAIRGAILIFCMEVSVQISRQADAADLQRTSFRPD